MDIAIIGTGFIATTLGRALVGAGHRVSFGSRHPDDSEDGAVPGAEVTSVADALAGSEVVILAVPGPAVVDLTANHGSALAGALVIDATNTMGAATVNSRAELPATVRYARAFNTLSGETMADPQFADGPADMFFSAPPADRSAVEAVIEGVGLRPIYVGEDEEAVVDALFSLWIDLAVTQGRGRHLALRLLDH
jgi:predicted dinucleotide-binding enzyme